MTSQRLNDGPGPAARAGGEHPVNADPAPTAKQLSYLRALAQRTGQTFAYPKTRQQASREITRLKHTRPSSRIERRIERKLIADQIQAGPQDASRVRSHEIAGHGSSATWKQNRPQEPPAAQDPGPSKGRPRPVVGQRTELARYSLGTGEQRVIYGQRVDGMVRFLPCLSGVLAQPPGPNEDDACRCRSRLPGQARPDAVRRKRLHGRFPTRLPNSREVS